eukprot:CAMPEP_0172832768 /NCGR_PEP_ID=MMETSP1075-20121228/23892_1 /TAXON_ID=2916 /ORGANISM="Ceratium fusus, Strain PA161109" /LENGTH=86 /DNA_ID=CAMNT_0013675421 /DNA_START=411 /DNA_END=671 /DNA_ORIENTATION=-
MTRISLGDMHLPYPQRESNAVTSQSHGSSSLTRLQSLGTKSSVGQESSSMTTASGAPSAISLACALKCAEAQPTVPSMLPMFCFHV